MDPHDSSYVFVNMPESNLKISALFKLAIPIDLQKQCSWTIRVVGNEFCLHFTMPKGEGSLNDIIPDHLRQKTVLGTHKQSSRGLKYDVQITSYNCVGDGVWELVTIPFSKIITFADGTQILMTMPYTITVYGENCSLPFRAVNAMLTTYLPTMEPVPHAETRELIQMGKCASNDVVHCDGGESVPSVAETQFDVSYIRTFDGAIHV